MSEPKQRSESWASFTERRIQQAIQAGEFDHLERSDRPMPDIGDLHEQDWWLRRTLRRESLSLLPPALAIRLDVSRTLERIRSLSNESNVRSELAALNQRIRQANFAAITGPPTTTMPLDIERAIEDWRGQPRQP